MLPLTPVVRVLLFITAGIFALQALVLPNLPAWLGLHNVYSPLFNPIQFVSHIFLHANIGHLFSNMFALLMFGPALEGLWGGRRFLFFYLFTGIGAGLLYWGINYLEVSNLREAATLFLKQPTPEHFLSFVTDHLPALNNDRFNEAFYNSPDNAVLIGEGRRAVQAYVSQAINAPMIGASGAVFGILMGFGMMFPNLPLMLLFVPIPIKAKYFVALYGLFELYSGLHRNPGDNVAHFAHVGGMLFAFILLRYWSTRQRQM